MITVDIESPAPPNVILAALREHAGEWRESQIPPILRSAGITAAEGWVAGTTYVLMFAPRGHGERDWGQFLRARAIVSPAGAGSRIRVVVDYHMRDVVMPMIGGAFLTFIGVVAFGLPALWLVVWPLSVWVLTYGWSRLATRRVSRTGSAPADYLVRRIEAAVAGARGVSDGARAS